MPAPLAPCRSGTDEAYEEKDQLLDGLVELYVDEQEEKSSVAAARKSDADKAEKDRLLGLRIRDDATKTLAGKLTSAKAAKGMSFFCLLVFGCNTVH